MLISSGWAQSGALLGAMVEDAAVIGREANFMGTGNAANSKLVHRQRFPLPQNHPPELQLVPAWQGESAAWNVKENTSLQRMNSQQSPMKVEHVSMERMKKMCNK